MPPKSKPIHLVCEQCGDPFTVSKPSLKRRFCTRTCQGQFVARRRYADVDYACVDCGKKVSAPHIKRCRQCDTDHRRLVNAAKPKAQSQCKRCGKMFDLEWPSQKRVYCGRECSDATNKNPPAKVANLTCPRCNKKFTTPITNGKPRTRYCSGKCAQRARAKIHVGRNHPSYKPRTPLPCRVCGKIVMVKPCLVERFRCCSRRCTGVWSQQFVSRVSSIEYTMADLFDKAGLNYTPQRVIGPYIVDFAFLDARVVVECDGTYWHSLPGKPAKDRMKNGYFKKHGWTMVRLPEADIRADAEGCLQRVISALHGEPSQPVTRNAPTAGKSTSPNRRTRYVQRSLEV